MATVFHCQRFVMPDGEEYVSPGVPPGGTVNQTMPYMIADFVRRDDWVIPQFDKDERHLVAQLQRNRDAHYPFIEKTILDAPECRGKTFLIVCPGPSLAPMIQEVQQALERPEVVGIVINRAIKYLRIPANQFAYITEAHALCTDWCEQENVLAPWAGACKLITSPDAAAWLVKVWPDDQRYYFIMQWAECPQDPRALPYMNRGAVAYCFVLSPVMALDAARRMGARKIILVGCDFALDLEGRYYLDALAWDHVCEHHRRALYTFDGTGQLCLTNMDLLFRRNSMEAVCYWLERSARVPILNASGGTLLWHTMSLQEALDYDGEPIVDYQTGDFYGETNGSGRLGPREVHAEVARSGLSPAIAGNRRRPGADSGIENALAAP